MHEQAFADLKKAHEEIAKLNNDASAIERKLNEEKLAFDIELQATKSILSRK